MRTKMKALVKEANRLSVRSVPMPQIEHDDDVIVRVELSGLCRTDVYVAEGMIRVGDERILGHEFAGVVEKVGDQVSDLPIGKRVAVNPLFACRKCSHCQSGADKSCQDTAFLGIDHDGCFAQFVRLPKRALFPLSDNISHLQAAYAEPVAASLAVMKTGIQPDEKGLVLGNNRFSHLMMKIFALSGFKNVTVSAHDCAIGEFDFVVETSMAEGTIDKMVALVRPGGRIILKSRHYEPVSFRLFDAIRKEPVIHIVNYGDFNTALEMLSSGNLEIGDLVDDKYSIDEYEAVFARSKKTEALKAFFDFGEG